MVYFSVIVISTLICAFLNYYLQSERKDPPGPWGLPLLGNLLSLETQLHKPFQKWGEKYGPVVGIRLGQYRAIVLTDMEVIREACNHPAFIGRPKTELINFYANGKHGILNGEGSEWTEQRRFTLRTLRDFGFGKKSMESSIMNEVNGVLGWMKTNEGKAVSVNRKFSLAVVNSLMTIMCGKRFDQEDPFRNVLEKLMIEFTNASKFGLLWFMPSISKHFPWLLQVEKLREAINPIRRMLQDIINEHLAETSGDSYDLCSAYLEEVKNTTNPNSSFYKDRGHSTLVTVLIDLFGAGSETTTTALAWIILHLIVHREVQSKLQAELDQVTGRTRTPCLADQSNTPYAEAVILESLRIASFVPYGVIRSTSEDVEFHGYSIPKETIVIGNLYSAHHDVKTWGDPQNFRPERFLSGDGKTVQRNPSLVPFSLGKRVCPGEALARNQIYLFMTNIFQKFEVIPDPAESIPSLESTGSIILMPKPYNVIFSERT